LIYVVDLHQGVEPDEISLQWRSSVTMRHIGPPRGKGCLQLAINLQHR
jgi:hypothetical protein